MPVKKKEVKKATVKKPSKLANVKVTVIHIVPTTQYGNVTYKAECDANQAEEVGVFMAELIGSLYPPFNPGDDIKSNTQTVDPSNDPVEAFNREASEVTESDVSADDFDF